MSAAFAFINVVYLMLVDKSANSMFNKHLQGKLEGLIIPNRI
jgi:hypothetical protein